MNEFTIDNLFTSSALANLNLSKLYFVNIAINSIVTSLNKGNLPIKGIHKKIYTPCSIRIFIQNSITILSEIKKQTKRILITFFFT